MVDKIERLMEWVMGQPPPAEELRRVRERLKELKGLRRRVTRLEKQAQEYQDTLVNRRRATRAREQEFIDRLDTLERRIKGK